MVCHLYYYGLLGTHSRPYGWVLFSKSNSNINNYDKFSKFPAINNVNKYITQPLLYENIFSLFLCYCAVSYNFIYHFIMKIRE